METLQQLALGTPSASVVENDSIENIIDAAVLLDEEFFTAVQVRFVFELSDMSALEPVAPFIR